MQCRNDLAADFVGTSIASCLYQPRVQITIDMRWVAALLGAVPFGRLFVPLTWPAVKVIVKVTERVLRSISSITGKLLLGAKDSDSRVVASHGKQDNQVADPASKQNPM